MTAFASPANTRKPVDKESTEVSLGEPIGMFHTWWRGDTLADMPSLPGLTIEPMREERDGALASGIGGEEIERRMRQHHDLWLATLNGDPAGWGWCARKALAIGELAMERALPPGNRYLWDFFTRPSLRGRGIYPRILQAIVRSDTTAERFWLGHDLQNLASRRGIAKAGFREVGLLYRQPDGSFILVPNGDLKYATAASELFAVHLAGIERNHSP